MLSQEKSLEVDTLLCDGYMFSVYQTQFERRIHDVVVEPLAHLGYEIVRIRYNAGQRYKILQIMIERLDGSILTIDDCEKATVRLSVLLDVHELVKSGPYSLEISSPGVERPLTREKDFLTYNGCKVRCKTTEMVECTRKFSGYIKDFRDGILVLLPNDEVRDEFAVSIKIAIKDLEYIYLQVDWEAVLKDNKSRLKNKVKKAISANEEKVTNSSV